jgi:hypothetical protein
VPTPGSGAPLKPGEFILGYPDEAGPPANLPQPETLSRNGSYMAYRGCKSMLAGSASSYARTLALPRNRSFWQRSSWVAGGVVRRSCVP